MINVSIARSLTKCSKEKHELLVKNNTERAIRETRKFLMDNIYKYESFIDKNIMARAEERKNDCYFDGLYSYFFDELNNIANSIEYVGYSFYGKMSEICDEFMEDLIERYKVEGFKFDISRDSNIIAFVVSWN